MATSPVAFPLEDFKADLDRDEGFKLAPYRDTNGNWTGGRGHFIGDDHALAAWKLAHPRGLGKVGWEAVFGQDLTNNFKDMDRLIPWWRSLSAVRQRVIANLCFNMGADHFCKEFPFTLELIEAGSYPLAAKQLDGSLLAKQVGNRERRLSWMLRYDNTNWPTKGTDSKGYL